jgi:hypothetical protein
MCHAEEEKKSGTSMLPQIKFFAPSPGRKTHRSHHGRSEAARINRTTALIARAELHNRRPVHTAEIQSRTCKKPSENKEWKSQK